MVRYTKCCDYKVQMYRQLVYLHFFVGHHTGMVTGLLLFINEQYTAIVNM